MSANVKRLQIRMRTITHIAVESVDRMDPASGTYITCECGKKAVTRDEIARMHQRSQRVIPGVRALDEEPDAQPKLVTADRAREILDAGGAVHRDERYSGDYKYIVDDAV